MGTKPTPRAQAAALILSLFVLEQAIFRAPAGAAEWKTFSNLPVHTSEWTHQDVDGRHTYLGVNSHGDRMHLSCNPQDRRDGWIIDILIQGAPPPADEKIKFRVGNKSITMRSSLDSRIHLDDAPHADPHYWLWTMLQQERFLAIILADDRSAVFNLKDASAALSDGNCEPITGR